MPKITHKDIVKDIARGGGRPTKYIWDTEAKEEKMLIEILDIMAEGGSLIAVACHLGITRETLDQWRKDKKKKLFSDIITRGRQLSLYWWEKQGTKLGPQAINHQLWFMNMKNRHGWKDKHEIEQIGEASRVIIQYPDSKESKS